MAVLHKSGSAEATDLAEEMAWRIRALVYEYEKRVSVSLAIGVLEIVKLEILSEQE